MLDEYGDHIGGENDENVDQILSLVKEAMKEDKDSVLDPYQPTTHLDAMYNNTDEWGDGWTDEDFDTVYKVIDKAARAFTSPDA